MEQLPSNWGLVANHLQPVVSFTPVLKFTIPSKSQVPSELRTQLGTEKDPAPGPAGLALSKTAKLLVGFGDMPHTLSAQSPLRGLCSCRSCFFPF